MDLGAEPPRVKYPTSSPWVSADGLIESKTHTSLSKCSVSGVDRRERILLKTVWKKAYTVISISVFGGLEWLISKGMRLHTKPKTLVWAKIFCFVYGHCSIVTLKKRLHYVYYFERLFFLNEQRSPEAWFSLQQHKHWHKYNGTSEDVHELNTQASAEWITTASFSVLSNLHAVNRIAGFVYATVRVRFCRGCLHDCYSYA